MYWQKGGAMCRGISELRFRIYLSIATNKWKIWAYENVHLIHKFENKSREVRLIDKKFV
jgi:hypothetical protein